MTAPEASDDPGPHGFGPEVTDPAFAERLRAGGRLEELTGTIVADIEADGAPWAAAQIDELTGRLDATFRQWRAEQSR